MAVDISRSRKMIVLLACVTLLGVATYEVQFRFFNAPEKTRESSVAPDSKWQGEFMLTAQERASLEKQMGSSASWIMSARRIEDEPLTAVFPKLHFVELLKVSSSMNVPISPTKGIPFREWVAFDMSAKIMAGGGRFGSLDKLFTDNQVVLSTTRDAMLLGAALDQILNPHGFDRTWKDGVHQEMVDGSWVFHLSKQNWPRIMFKVDKNSVITSCSYDQSPQGKWPDHRNE